MSQSSCGETLRDLLESQHIPPDSFSREELSASVQGTGKDDGMRAVMVYNKLQGDAFVGPLQLLEYGHATKKIATARLQLDQRDICLGSTEEVYLIDGYTLFSTHINPSAECLVLVDKELAIKQRFYGFFPVRIAPGLIAITENMVHFAAVHPERMQLIDLATSRTIEIYPPANDPLRARLALEHAKHMPGSDICMRMNDPCDPKLFDESFYAAATEGDGRIAFLVSQSASHAVAENTEPETVAEQVVFYNYARKKGRWLYCEEPIQAGRAEKLENSLKTNFKDEVARHCKPNRLVSPDMSTADYNPFRKR